MNHLNVLTASKHFSPDIHNPSLIVIDKKVIIHFLETHYAAISLTIKEDMERKYSERGYLITIGGRDIISNRTTAYQSLIDGGLHDIMKSIKDFLSIENGDFSYAICDDAKVNEIKLAIRQKIAGFKWRIQPTIALEVIRETD